MSDKHTPGEWVLYSARKPAAEGVYEWRIPSAALPDAVVLFHAHMRKRGAGYVDVISPSFDHWDGYRVNVHPEAQWREAAPGTECEKHDYANLRIEGLNFLRCPFCRSAPTLKGSHRAYGGGVFVNGKPHHLNSWWLQCCQWGHTPHLGDPREIERVRRAAFGKQPETEGAGS